MYDFGGMCVFVLMKVYSGSMALHVCEHVCL